MKYTDMLSTNIGIISETVLISYLEQQATLLHCTRVICFFFLISVEIDKLFCSWMWLYRYNTYIYIYIATDRQIDNKTDILSMCDCYLKHILFSMTQQPLVGHNLLII